VSTVLAAADWLLSALHMAVVLAFVLLWIPRSTARFHGWLVLVTAFSWLVLGVLGNRGLGYCFLTDLQWHVKHARGVTHLPGSFLKYAGDHVTGRNLKAALVDQVAGATFIFVCLAAAFRYWQRRTLARRSRES